MRILPALLAIALLSACGSPSSTGATPAASVSPPLPTPSTSPTPPPGATQAVYFSIVPGADPARVAALAMGRPVYIERAPGPGANPGDGIPERVAFLAPITPGAERDALGRFKAVADVTSASLGRYPPFIPS